MASRNYPCRVRGCSAHRKSSELVCRDHWFKLPKAIRDQIWAEYKRDAGSPDHLRVAAAAIRSLAPIPIAVAVQGTLAL